MEEVSEEDREGRISAVLDDALIVRPDAMKVEMLM